MSKMHAEGVTLIELMVAVLVLGAVMAVGVPAFSDIIANNRMNAAVNDVVSSLHLARSEAVKRRSHVTLCPAASSTTCTPGGGLQNGWLVFADPDASGILDGGENEVIQYHPSLNASIGDFSTWGDENGAATGHFFITYQPTGYLLATIDDKLPITNLQFCDKRGNREAFGGTASGRWVQISATGRPRILSDSDQINSTANPLNGCPEPG
jgi:type IV fimbrial biogenesis protein FimT